jgi:hypothetical protein
VPGISYTGISVITQNKTFQKILQSAKYGIRNNRTHGNKRAKVDHSKPM